MRLWAAPGALLGLGPQAAADQGVWKMNRGMWPLSSPRAAVHSPCSLTQPRPQFYWSV